MAGKLRKPMGGGSEAQNRVTELVEEVRSAVIADLAGISEEELALLDSASREAEQYLDAMAVELQRLNANVDRALDEARRLRSELPELDGRVDAGS